MSSSSAGVVPGGRFATPGPAAPGVAARGLAGTDPEVGRESSVEAHAAADLEADAGSNTIARARNPAPKAANDGLRFADRRDSPNSRGSSTIPGPAPASRPQYAWRTRGSWNRGWSRKQRGTVRNLFNPFSAGRRKVRWPGGRVKPWGVRGCGAIPAWLAARGQRVRSTKPAGVPGAKGASRPHADLSLRRPALLHGGAVSGSRGTGAQER